MHVEAAFVARIGATKVLGKLRHSIRAADLDQHVIHMNRLRVLVFLLRSAIERDLCVVAVAYRTPLDRRVGGFLFLHRFELIFYVLLGNRDLRMLGPKFLVALDLDLRHYFEAGLKVQAFAVMCMQVGNSRLGDRNQAEPLCLLTKKTGYQCVHNVVLDFLFEALAYNGRRHVSLAESRNARQLLIFLNEDVGFARDFFGGYLDLNLTFRALGGFSRTHGLPFWQELSVKTGQVNRQTVSGVVRRTS